MGGHFIFEHYLTPAERVFENKNKNPWEKTGTGPKHPETLLEHPRNTPGTPGIPRNTPLTGQTLTQADGPWGIYNFLINIFYPIWCLPCSRSITHKIHLFWFCLVFFVFDILSLIKKYIYIFCVLMFHIDFSGNLWFPKFIIALDFSNGVFDFQNDIEMDVTASQ